MSQGAVQLSVQLPACRWEQDQLHQGGPRPLTEVETQKDSDWPQASIHQPLGLMHSGLQRWEHQGLQKQQAQEWARCRWAQCKDSKTVTAGLPAQDSALVLEAPSPSLRGLHPSWGVGTAEQEAKDWHGICWNRP